MGTQAPNVAATFFNKFLFPFNYCPHVNGDGGGSEGKAFLAIANAPRPRNGALRCR